MQYTLSDIAKLFDIPVSTLRYYEKEGGLSFFRRDDNGYILVDKADISSVQLLKFLMQAGLPVKSISRIIGTAEATKNPREPQEITAAYLQIADAMDEHEDSLLRKQQKLLEQIEVTRYLRWEFMRYARAGKSTIAEEPYPGPLPAGFSNNDMDIGLEELKKEFDAKYPGWS